MHEDVMEKAVTEDNLDQALRAVIRNRGAAGIDRMTVDELEHHFNRHRDKIVGKLLDGRWAPSPVKRVADSLNLRGPSLAAGSASSGYRRSWIG